MDNHQHLHRVSTGTGCLNRCGR